MSLALPNLSAIDQWRKGDIGHHATGYAANGMAVFPVHGIVDGLCTCGKKDCSNAGKHPATLHGCKDATTDVIKLAALFHYRNDYNIGIATGKASNIFVLDVDSKDGISGEDSLRDLQDEHGMLPATLICKTGRGRHFYFTYPNFEIKNATSIAPCLDIRGNNGYVVAAPSMHKSGIAYRWETELEAVDAPEWLLEMLRPKPKERKPLLRDYSTSQRSEWSKDEIWRMLDCISPDISYNEWLQVGMALHEGGFSLSLWDEWSHKGTKYENGDCDKRWRGFNATDGITVGTLVDMARLNGWQPTPYDRPVIDTSAVDGLVERIQGGNVKEIPDFKFDFDPLALPGLIGDTVRSIIKYALQPQPELALLNTLAFAGAVFGRRYASPMNTRTNVYMIGIARTAAGKDHSRQYISGIAEKAGLLKYLGSQYIRSDTSMLCDVQDKPSHLMMIDEIGMYLEAVSNPRAPTHIRNVSAAITRLYTSSGTFYDHGQTADRRIKPIIIQRPNLCLYGTTTEKNYAKALRTESVESGELNRFLVYKSERVFTGDEPEPPAREIDENLVQDWASYAGTDFGLAEHPPEPVIVEWNEECKALQRHYYKKQMQIINQETKECLLWGRYMESIVKVAMMFAIGRDKQFPAFSPQDFSIAAKLVDSCLAYMAFLASDHISDSAYEDDQKKILHFLKRHKNGVSITVLNNNIRSIKSRDRKDLLADMISLELIEIIEVKGKTKKGHIVKAL